MLSSPSARGGFGPDAAGAGEGKLGDGAGDATPRLRPRSLGFAGAAGDENAPPALFAAPADGGGAAADKAAAAAAAQQQQQQQQVSLSALLAKAAAAPPADLAAPQAPVAAFGHRHALLPDGLGDARHLQFVREALSTDAVALQGWARAPAEERRRRLAKAGAGAPPEPAGEPDAADELSPLELLDLAAEAVLRARSGGVPGLQDDPDDPRSANSLFPSLALVDDGLAGGGPPLPLSAHTARAVAQSCVRAHAAAEVGRARQARAARRRRAAAAAEGDAGDAAAAAALAADAAAEAADAEADGRVSLSPAEALAIAMRITPRPAGDPVDRLVGRVTVVADRFADRREAGAGRGAGGDAGGGMGSVSSAIGAASLLTGAATASEYQAKADLAAQVAQLQAQAGAGAGAGAAMPALPLLRIVRPLSGDAIELALSNASPATLTVNVAGVHFRDHALFSREDYLASGLRALYGEYARRMRAGAVLTASLDARLRALLSHRVEAVGGSLERVYDFEADAAQRRLQQLCARAGAVLEALSARHSEVTACADVMRRMWATWTLLVAERAASGLTNTPLRLEAVEVAGGRAGPGAEPPALYDQLHAAAVLLDCLQAAAAAREQDAAAGGAGGGSPRAQAQARAALGDPAVARRLVDAGVGLIVGVVRAGERDFGAGYGCGAMGSGVADVAALVEAAEAAAAAAAPAAGSALSASLGAASGLALANAAAAGAGLGGRGAFPGAREFVLRLHSDTALTPDAQATPAERARRQAVAATFVVAEVLVNGRPVAASAPARLGWPDFAADISLAAAIRVFRRPAALAVRVVDASSVLRFVLGPTVLAEVPVPVPGRKDRDRDAAARDDRLAGAVATSALEQTAAVYEFSAGAPMARPFFELHAAAAAARAAAAATGAPADALPADPAALTSGARGAAPAYLDKRMACGAVAVAVAWQMPDEEREGRAGAGAGALSARADAAAAAAAVVALPSRDSGPAPGGLGAGAGPATPASTAAAVASEIFRVLSGSPGSVGPVTVGAHARAGDGAGMGDARLLREYVSLPVPRATSQHAQSAQALAASQAGLGAAAIQQLPGAIGGSPGSPEPAQSGAQAPQISARAPPTPALGASGLRGSLPIPLTPARGAGAAGGAGAAPATAAPGTALRRSAVLAREEESARLARAGVSSSSIPLQGQDPNDPRVARRPARSPAGGAGAGAGGRARSQRSTGFRVTPLAQSLAFAPSSASALDGGFTAPAAFGGAGAGGLSDALFSAVGGQPLAGQQRMQLLRLRGERPDLFREVREPVPLVDDDVARSPALLELLRTALVSLGFSELALDAAENGPLAFMREGARALGMTLRAGDAAGSADEWLMAGGAGSVAAAQKARLLSRVKDFLKRVRASPAGGARASTFGRGGAQLGHVVKQHELPDLRGLILNFDVLFLLFQARRRLRPRAVDLGVPSSLDFADGAGALGLGLGGAASSIMASLGGGALVRALSPTYKITVQVVRARNVPLRRPAAGARGAGAGAGVGEAPEEPCVAVVEVRFQGASARTSSCAGANPQWNEILSLPFSPPGGDSTPARLAEISDSVVLSLYDEASVEQRADDRDKTTTVVRRQMRWLGSVTVPFSFLFSQGGLRGELRLEAPPVNLGYRAPAVVNQGASTVVALGGAARVGAPAGGVNGAPMNGGGLFGAAAGARGAGGLQAAISEQPAGLLAAAEANRRATHVYVHIGVDPPLPAPGGAAGDEDEEHEESLAALAEEGPAACCGDALSAAAAAAARELLARARQQQEEAAGAAAGAGAAAAGAAGAAGAPATAITVSGAAKGAPAPDVCGRCAACGYCGAPFVHACGPAGAATRTVKGAAAAAGPGGFRERELHGLRYEGPPEGRRLLEAAARWSDRHSRRRESSASALSPLGGGRGVRLPRVVKAVASSINGEAVLVTRYLCPQAPPPDAASAVAAAMQAEAAALKLEAEQQRAAAAEADRGARRARGAEAEEAAARAAYVAAQARAAAPVSSIVPRVVSPDAAARFVSLVPFLADGQAFGGGADVDLWATTQEFLDMGAGDSEEHAIMLHNFLLWFEEQGQGGEGLAGAGAGAGAGGAAARWRSYIVLGRAQPEGETTWVLRLNSATVPATALLINASTRRSYFAGDDSCPLRSIGMVASQYNLWANTQPFTEPWRMAFELGDETAWAPFFTSTPGGPGGARGPRGGARARDVRGGTRPHPGLALLPPVQGAVVYHAPQLKLAAALEAEIAAAATAALRALRPRYITRVRSDVSSALRPLLLELEARACGAGGPYVLAASDGMVQVTPTTGGPATQAVAVGAAGQLLLSGAATGGSGVPAGGAGAMRDLTLEHQQRLEALVSRYRALGCPLNVSFTDMDAVIASLRNTGLHKIEDESAQFAVGVAVVPFPNDVFSVWLYPVALLPGPV